MASAESDSFHYNLLRRAKFSDSRLPAFELWFNLHRGEEIHENDRWQVLPFRSDQFYVSLEQRRIDPEDDDPTDSREYACYFSAGSYGLDSFLDYVVRHIQLIKNHFHFEYSKLFLNCGPLSDNNLLKCSKFLRVIETFQNPEVANILPIEELQLNVVFTDTFASCLSKLIAASIELKTLTLCINGTKTYNLKHLGTALQGHPSLVSLNYLACFENDPSDIDFELNHNLYEWLDNHIEKEKEEHFTVPVAKALTDVPNLETINISNEGCFGSVECPFDMESILHLVQGKSSDKKIALRFSHCQFPVKRIRKMLEDYTGLREIELGSRCLLSDKGFEQLFSGLLHGAKCLEELSIFLDHRPLGIPASLALMDLIVGTTSLKDLHVKHCKKLWDLHCDKEERDYASYAVARALCTNRSLVSLHLCCQCMQAQGYEEFEDAFFERSRRKQAKLGTLEYKRTLGNPEKASIASVLMESLNENQHLKSLDLSFSSGLISDNQNTYTNQLVENKSLERLDLSGIHDPRFPQLISCKSIHTLRDLERTALQLVARCTNLMYLRRSDTMGIREDSPERGRYVERSRFDRYLEEINRNQGIISFLCDFRQHWRHEIIHPNAHKDEAVRVLAHFIDELLCIYEALHLAPTLFFSS